jgi:predicted dithiol-disulfide oxidoreductase (DUF899 family)
VDNISRTYSSYARGDEELLTTYGDEELLTTYMVLDLTPKGRYASGPHGNLTDWVRRHDEYNNVKATQSCCER